MCYYDQLNSIHLVSLSIFCRWLRFYELGCCLFRMLRLFYHYLFEIYFTMSFLYNFLSKEFFFVEFLCYIWLLLYNLETERDFQSKSDEAHNRTLFMDYITNKPSSKKSWFFSHFFSFQLSITFQRLPPSSFFAIFSCALLIFIHIYIYMFVIDIHI